MNYRASAVLAIAILGLVAFPPLAGAVGNEDPAPPPQPQTNPKPKPSNQPSSNTNKPKPDNTNKQKGSSNEFLRGYREAHALIYRQKQYEAGIAKLRSLGQDDHPDVANLIGFSSRRLGRYDDAKLWYERALKSDPRHALTWSYYGMWHAEQGNLLKARDHLAVVQSICGTTCREYTELKGVIEGTRLY